MTFSQSSDICTLSILRLLYESPSDMLSIAINRDAWPQLYCKAECLVILLSVFLSMKTIDLVPNLFLTVFLSCPSLKPLLITQIKTRAIYTYHFLPILTDRSMCSGDASSLPNMDAPIGYFRPVLFTFISHNWGLLMRTGLWEV